MSVLIQDSTVSGHMKWSGEALSHGDAAGLVVSPFFTPFTHQKAQPSAAEFAAFAHDSGSEYVFDATTHAFAYGSTDLFAKYATWDLWGDRRGALNTKARRDTHLSKVFDIQRALSAPFLAPTIGLDNALGDSADHALDLAASASSLEPGAWQSLAGRRGLWLSPDLDTYVGAIQELRSPTVVMTYMRDDSTYPVDDSDIPALIAYLRTIRSLSRLSRVVAAHSDFTGLLAVAAGASTIGSGWHGKQRTMGPDTFARNESDSVRRSATWFTYAGLLARLHKNDHDLLVRHEPLTATALYSGPAIASASARHCHHLGALSDISAAIIRAGDTASRVETLREMYEGAADDLNRLAMDYSREFAERRKSHNDKQREVLEAFALAEGL